MDKIRKNETDSPGSDDRFVIVVGRQYGSGGRSIGRMLARELGVGYYDKTLLKEAAESFGYSPDIFERGDEKRPSFLRSLLSLNYGATSDTTPASVMSDERLYQFQSDVIKNICERESCVIVGRTADYVMRHHPRLVSIFLHAPIEARVKRIMERGDVASEKEAREKAQKIDRNRESYYNYYTNRPWGVASNYHLSIDSSRVSEEAILAIVKDILERKV